ncbi:SWIB-domain-containing protein [Lophium mytilinum]|uniref:SWIB-domain-containing protein n=1 Tax=Lophium mytilinum TaxID=390894 RepID=A0A6A6R729_9PEZI|nr:SWIB-domain-containing protein [Lophium mytilinum]
MASLPPEVEASYSAIIDSILANSDLNTISAKRIRKGLQAQVDYDITHQKDQVTQLIMSRFDKFNHEQTLKTQQEVADPPKPAPTAKTPPTTNGIKDEESRDSSDVVTPSDQSSPQKRAKSEEESELSEVEPSPPKKKHKKSNKVAEEDDATLAARLQAEENRHARSTRGGNTKKRAAVVKKKDKAAKKKQKSARKINSDDDSEVESGDGAKKKEVNRNSGFHKPMNLSPALSELLGETSLSRPQTVKKIWEYVKERDLQDPSDKRQIRCDNAMRAVFKQDRVHMFTMNKILNQNLYAQDE